MRHAIFILSIVIFLTLVIQGKNYDAWAAAICVMAFIEEKGLK